MTQDAGTTPRSIDLSLALREAADRLESEFDGTYGRDTVERFVASSYDQLVDGARVLTYVPLLAERFARERLHALSRLEGRHAAGVPAVLFLCVHNAGRSQMAMGFLQAMADDRVVAWSGGSEPGSAVNPAAVAAMAERGIDIAREFPKPWTDEVVRAADVVVTMGCGDTCPVFPGTRYVDWELDDPAGQGIEDVRPIRDEIERRVGALVAELGVEPTQAPGATTRE